MFKTKRKAKLIEGKSNYQSKNKTIFNDLISKRKSIMNELYENVDYNNSKFEYVGHTKDVSFHEYMDSRELSNKIKIRFDDALKRQNVFLNKLNEIETMDHILYQIFKIIFNTF